ncbi:DUF4825 domain-containing protein [Ammoniphilus resinae]|uniref:DUF4825 domain-containing protein n=1 Tax=Ammoniphilus resinae TaxID=861532 RepID=A0ABS4GXE6_9BACL|nr:DUF4825 domain-containing protein [Ammoniphilus resinae]MBP1934540.1 hypothetical protein [Ammoniphilus resinae]
MRLTSYLILLFLLTGCGSNNGVDQDIFQYKGSYTGDNSAVGNIIHQLPEADFFKQVMLQTEKEPYGMEIQYGDINGDIQSSTINNASYLFALVKNVEWITFEYPNETYTLTRQQLQQWYGKDLSEITNEKDLKKLIQTNTNDKNKVDKLLEK